MCLEFCFVFSFHFLSQDVSLCIFRRIVLCFVSRYLIRKESMLENINCSAKWWNVHKSYTARSGNIPLRLQEYPLGSFFMAEVEARGLRCVGQSHHFRSWPGSLDLVFIFQTETVGLTCLTLQLEQCLFLICKLNRALNHVLPRPKCITPVAISEFLDGLEKSTPNVYLTL